MTENNICFYINSIGPDGLVSVCEKCANDTLSTRTYLIRGGIGVTSDFIEKIAASLQKEGLRVERFLNFADSKPDGAYFPEIDTYLFDANKTDIPSPMIGSCQYTVDLGVAENKKELYLSRALIEKSKSEEEKYIQKAVRFLSTVKSVRDDSLKLSFESVNAEKVERFVARLVKKEFGTFSSYTGREYFRFLGSVTPDGIHIPEVTIKAMCPKVYCIEDKTDACSSLIISQIKDNALLCGFDVISLLSPFNAEKNPEHLIVPELGLGIITSNKSHKYSSDCFKKISSARFTDSEKMRKHMSRIKFNLNAEKELLNQACYLLGEAQKRREEYLQIYKKYTDLNEVNQCVEKLKAELLSYISCT